MNIDATHVSKRGQDATMPVTTAIYTVQFIMNEDDPYQESAHVERFTAEIQRMLDTTDFTTALRYDAITFDVLARTVIGTTEPDKE